MNAGGSRQNSESLFDRRTWLKSAGAVFGLSTLSASALPNDLLPAFDQTSSEASSNVASCRFKKGLLGFMLGHEQFPLPQLVDIGVAAEQAGFDLLATSDHLQPWQANEGHSGEAWVTMGALGQRTRRAWMGTTVTCPTFRYHPAVIAEAFASLSLLYPGRIFLGLGSGEALNEQAAVGTWPKWQERSERLIEATDIIRRLWTGQQIVHKGKYYDVNCKLYDQPTKSIPILMAANGPKAMRRAGQYADGLITDTETWKQHKPEFCGQRRRQHAGTRRSIHCLRGQERSGKISGALALHSQGIQDLLQRSRPAGNSASRRGRTAIRPSLWKVDREH
jgi:alkanesulfonate monooxygenase SsuD/methylene tetrahydromethanopterin reductase-like flavin-dependent oxidoreductase (luciferase family)